MAQLEKVRLCGSDHSVIHAVQIVPDQCWLAHPVPGKKVLVPKSTALIYCHLKSSVVQSLGQSPITPRIHLAKNIL